MEGECARRDDAAAVDAALKQLQELEENEDGRRSWGSGSDVGEHDDINTGCDDGVIAELDLPSKACLVDYRDDTTFLQLDMWAHTYGRGSDIHGARNKITQLTHDVDTTLDFSLDCLAHQYQLVDASCAWALEKALAPGFGDEWNGFRVYSRMAPVLHCIRDNQATIYARWVNRYTITDALRRKLDRVAPRPISGRWSRRHVCTNYLLALCDEPDGSFNHMKLAEMFAVAVGGRTYDLDLMREEAEADLEHAAGAADGGAGNGRGAGAKNKPRKRKRGQDLDDTQHDEANTRALSFGKWAKLGIHTLREVRFWICLKVSAVIADRLSVLHWTINQYTTQDKDKLYDVPAEDRELENLAWLTYGKGQRIYEPSQELKAIEPWQHVLGFVEKVVPGCLDQVQDAIHRMVMKVIADYKRMIIDRLTSFPIALLWLGHGSPNTVSDDNPDKPSRLSVCKRLLETPPARLHITAAKVVRLFRNELIWSLHNNGRARMALFAPVRSLACRWWADTSEMESIMSLIGLALSRAPRMNLPTLDARIGNIKDVGAWTRHPRHFKFSDVAPRIGDIVEDAVEFRSVGNLSLAEQGRWDVPGIAPPLPIAAQQVVISPSRMEPAALEWSSAQSLILHRKVAAHDELRYGQLAMVVTRVDRPDEVLEIWIHCDTTQYQSMLALADLSDDGDHAELKVPLTILPAVDMFARFYSGCIFDKEEIRIRFEPIKFLLGNSHKLLEITDEIKTAFPLCDQSQELLLTHEMPVKARAKRAPIFREPIGDAAPPPAIAGDEGDADFDQVAWDGTRIPHFSFR